MKIKALTCIVAILFAGHSLLAQTTIGMKESSVPGALLQLKELPNQSQGENSKRGLGLPRVELMNKYNLYPMFKGNADYENNINNTKDKLDLEHIGLLVYNTNRCVSDKYAQGQNAQVWNGENWDVIDGLSSKTNGTTATFVGTYLDARNNHTYYYRHIKSTDGTLDAGIWMLNNMTATTYSYPTLRQPVLGPDGDETTTVDGRETMSYTYPHDKLNQELDDSWFLEHKDVGLLYSWGAAVNYEEIKNKTSVRAQVPLVAGEIPGNNEVEVLFETAPGKKDGKIQGICPNGWHVPSWREWIKFLETVTYEPELYSTMTKSELSPWDPEWIIARPDDNGDADKGVSKPFLNKCPLVGDYPSKYVGASKPIGEGGIEISAAGMTFNYAPPKPGEDRPSVSAGTFCFYLTASQSEKIPAPDPTEAKYSAVMCFLTEDHIWWGAIIGDPNRHAGSRYSLRCIKDDKNM